MKQRERMIDILPDYLAPGETLSVSEIKDVAPIMVILDPPIGKTVTEDRNGQDPAYLEDSGT
jgi:hypothetical protein